MTKAQLAQELTQLEEELDHSIEREKILLNDLDYYIEEYESHSKVNKWTAIFFFILGLVIGLII